MGVAPFTKADLLARRSWRRHLWDAVGIPFRLALFPDGWNRQLGWSSLEEERLRAVLPHIQGRLLDVGAGCNTLANLYSADAVGVDVHDWGGGALVVEDTRQLPFPDASFDTITFLACLNHIPYRLEVLKEACRLLRPGGRVLVTMIGRFIGLVGHRIWWYSEDKHRAMHPDEAWGLDRKEVCALLIQAELHPIGHSTFVYGMNQLFIAAKDACPARGLPPPSALPNEQHSE